MYARTDLSFMTPFYVYVLARPDGIPFYVGKGSKRRCCELSKGRTKYFRHVIKKHGAENIRITTYPCESEQNAFDLEVIFIELFRWKQYPLVNLTDGGDGVRGYVFTPEVIAKMRAAQLGKKLPLEQRMKMSASRRGRTVSPETRAKISAAHRGKPKPRRKVI